MLQQITSTTQKHGNTCDNGNNKVLQYKPNKKTQNKAKQQEKKDAQKYAVRRAGVWQCYVWKEG